MQLDKVHQEMKHVNEWIPKSYENWFISINVFLLILFKAISKNLILYQKHESHKTRVDY